MNSRVLFIVLVLLLYVGYGYISKHPPSQPVPSQPKAEVKGMQIGVRTKIINCQANGPLQDLACTPGAIDPNLTKEVICSPTFTTKSVRNVPAAEKREVYAAYGILSHQPGEYEVDHLISLELGGANDIGNLWPEAAEPRPGFHEKDVVENYLHKQVCDGSITLEDAQREVANNWLQVYQSAPEVQSGGN